MQIVSAGIAHPWRVAGLAGESAACTALLDRLEAGGFVRRRRDPEDARRVVVETAAEGIAAFLARLERPGGNTKPRRAGGASDRTDGRKRRRP